MPELDVEGGLAPQQLQGEWAQRAFVELNESPEAVVEALHELKQRITGELSFNKHSYAGCKGYE